MALIAVLALTVMPAQAKAVLPVLEYVSPGNDFPIGFTATGGEVTAALTGFDTVVHCTGSHGDGEIIGPRSTVSSYAFTGCETQGGTEGGNECKSEGASAEEITAEEIEADLVYIDQAKHEVGMLLNPDGGVYMNFKCGGELVEASGRFLSPVGPINKEATSFTAMLSRSGAMQTPDEYENALGEKRPAIPMGTRGANPAATTGVELAFTIHTSASLQIKAVTAAEIEAKQREDKDAAAAAAEKRQGEEAATALVVKERQGEEGKLERLKRVLLSTTLQRCRQAPSKAKRTRCEKRARKKYGSAKSR